MFHIDKVCISAALAGSTFYASILVLCRLKPWSFVFENVPGLVTTGNLEKVQQKCEEAGYIFLWWWGNPTKSGIPQDRNRVWIVGWLRHLSPEQWAQEFERCMSKLVQELQTHPKS